MKETLTEGVCAVCKAVAEGASSVRNDRHLALSYAASLPLEQATARELDPDRHYFGDRDDTVAYFLTLDAINSGSGYFPHLRKRPGMSGSFTVADSSAEWLARLLVEMPYFYDVEPYEGLEVPFYKRAQLTAADLWVAFGGRGPGRFHDLERLTIFADNPVPHVLRVDRILLYDKALAARIDAEELTPAGSAEEVEIRARLHVVELLKRELHEEVGREVTTMGLDYLLWNRGQQPYYKKVRPRHRTRTVFY